MSKYLIFVTLFIGVVNNIYCTKKPIIEKVHVDIILQEAQIAYLDARYSVMFKRLNQICSEDKESEHCKNAREFVNMVSDELPESTRTNRFLEKYKSKDLRWKAKKKARRKKLNKSKKKQYKGPLGVKGQWLTVRLKSVPLLDVVALTFDHYNLKYKIINTVNDNPKLSLAMKSVPLSLFVKIIESRGLHVSYRESDKTYILEYKKKM